MSANSVRRGLSSTPTNTTVGVEGTSDAVWTFANDVRPCLISSLEDQPIFVKINGDDDNPASATDFDFHINPFFEDAEPGRHTFDLSLGGLINIKSLSIWAAASTVFDNLVIRGWEPK